MLGYVLSEHGASNGHVPLVARQAHLEVLRAELYSSALSLAAGLMLAGHGRLASAPILKTLVVTHLSRRLVGFEGSSLWCVQLLVARW